MRRKVSLQGNVIQVTELSGCNGSCHAVKVSATQWMDPETGELHDYSGEGSTKRTDNMQELRASFAKLRAIINTNCTKPRSLKWVTLTYAENMQDLRRLYEDFGRFVKRLRRKYGRCEYIAVPEPQGRGAWHVHLILIYDGVAPWIPNDEMEKMWGQGFTRTNKVREDVDNLGAYLSAYLTDTVAPDGERCDTVKMAADGKPKRIVKGGRLALYPAGMNVYRCSRGVKRPESYWVETPEQAEEVERIDEELEPYVRRYEVETDGGKVITVTHRYYNRKRKRRTRPTLTKADDGRRETEPHSEVDRSPSGAR